MNSGTRIGLAVSLGYLLGRRRKMRAALVLAAAVAAGRASREPGGLLQKGTDLLQSSPHLAGLGRLGGPLAVAGKAAATAAAGNGIDALGDKLRGKADALRRRSAGVAEHQSGGAAESADGGGEPSSREAAEPVGQRRGR
ncbi:hypothetical protein ACFOOK_19230 [Micromonospora krabiensis]|uniref:Uncharacterized protein n=1 Tax=Micromonospora krabiensis TaxID=307121 RepID=A0A1C3N9M1_9ACTN|nr:hypothetical protein [Micromonospora krabiensis]SBV29294.1 hypothetical protein GA0070620_4866 [Micromonospora krabiensis]